MKPVRSGVGVQIRPGRQAGAASGEGGLPPAASAGCLPQCAVDHDPREPHNQQSLFYQMKFYAAHFRFPTWTDAMGHCQDHVKAHWRIELRKLMTRHGIEIPADLAE